MPNIPGQQQLFSQRDFRAGNRISSYNYAQTGRAFVELTAESFKAIEDYVAWCENVAARKLPQAEDYMTMFLAMLAGGFAQKYSAGMKRSPNDSSRAWKMPVPRITSRYFLGWRVQRLRRGTWILTNDSREAYYIEYGIHRNPATGAVAARRIRRPIFKLTFLRTMEAVRSTALAHRVWSDILIPRAGEPGKRSRNLTWYSQPSGVMGTSPLVIGHVAGMGLLYKYGTIPK
jgi:hypothetical protein